MSVPGVSSELSGEPLTTAESTANVSTADMTTKNVTTADVLVLGLGLGSHSP